MAATTSNKKRKQNQASVRLIIMAAILVCVNILASYFHTGLDLTHEKRFTLSPSTKKLLGNMHEVAVFDIYLDGENFPAALQRMQEAIRERLRSFKDIAGDKVQFRFVDPMAGKTDAEKKQVAEEMRLKGMSYFNLRNNDESDYSIKVFYPYALLHYNGKEVPVMLLEDPPGKTFEEKLSYAEATLEYKFASAINQLNRHDVKRIAYITGNEEPLGVSTMDMLMTLPRYYSVDTIDLTRVASISRLYDAIIIHHPETPFTGPEKLKIDQYVMHGGHVLWALSTLRTSLDSFAHTPQFLALDYALDLDDLLFKYGVRINNDLVEDMQCAKIGRVENNYQTELKPWIYFPLFNPTGQHPIVRNMDFLLGGFTNTIDTLKTAGISKTVLLATSKYSRSSRAPLRVSLSATNYEPRPEMFPKHYLPTAILLEGTFHSAYNGLLAPDFLRYLSDSLKMPFKPVCDSPNSMIVVSSQDMFTNLYTTKDGVLPMGYSRWTGEFYTNKNFLLNCLEYLTDNSGILESRSKEVRLRLLDGARAKDEKATWEIVNIVVPVVVVLVFASVFLFFRKRRYEKRADKPTI